MKIGIKLLLSIVCLSFFVVFESVRAQEKLAITITPPIIKNNINPGQIWKSYLKVVNNNNTDIDVYVQLQNFESNGETGTVKLSPLKAEDIANNEYLINNWVIIEPGPFNVPANKSTEIPFIIDVPEKVDPGDHHIAFLVGTNPPSGDGQGSSIKVSSMLGSLLLLNVSGDVNERGVIREFSADKQVYNTGETSFTLRFENIGNTILQPQGEIKIFDYRGSEKGAVEINRKTSTGNVFPGDVRRWEFKWSIPKGFLEMGKYRADISLRFGNQSQNNAEQTIYFWVIQWRPLLIGLGTILFILVLIVFFVRRYIKNAIIRSQEEFGINNSKPLLTSNNARRPDSAHSVVDLKVKAKEVSINRVEKTKIKKNKKMSLLKKLLLIIATATLMLIIIFTYFYVVSIESPVAPIEEKSLNSEVDGTSEVLK
jgi:hypothetical protein